MAFIDLPSIINDTPIRMWEHEDVGVDILDFCMEKDRDLLLIIERPPGG